LDYLVFKINWKKNPDLTKTGKNVATNLNSPDLALLLGIFKLKAYNFKGKKKVILHFFNEIQFLL